MAINDQGYVLKFLSDEKINLQQTNLPLNETEEAKIIRESISESKEANNNFLCLLNRLSEGLEEQEIDNYIYEAADVIRKIIDNLCNFPVSAYHSSQASVSSKVSTRISARLSEATIINAAKKNKIIDPTVIQSYIQQLSQLSESKLIITEKHLGNIIDALTSELTIYSQSTKQLKEHEKNLKEIENNPPNAGWKIWEKEQKIHEWEQQKQEEMENIKKLRTKTTEKMENSLCLSNGIIKLLHEHKLPPTTEKSLNDIINFLISQLTIYGKLATQLKEHEKNLKKIENNPPNAGWKIWEKEQKKQEWEQKKQDEIECIKKLRCYVDKKREDSLYLSDYIVVQTCESNNEEEFEIIEREARNLELTEDNIAAAARAAIIMENQQQAIMNLEKQEFTERNSLYNIENCTYNFIELESTKSFEAATIRDQLRAKEEIELLKRTIHQFETSEQKKRLAFLTEEENEHNFIRDKQELLHQEIKRRGILIKQELDARNIVVIANGESFVSAESREKIRKEAQKIKQEEDRILLILKQKQAEIEKKEMLRRLEENEQLKKAAEEEKKRIEAEKQKQTIVRRANPTW